MLSKEEVRLIQRIRSGRFPHVEARPALGNHGLFSVFYGFRAIHSGRFPLMEAGEALGNYGVVRDLEFRGVSWSSSASAPGASRTWRRAQRSAFTLEDICQCG